MIAGKNRTGAMAARKCKLFPNRMSLAEPPILCRRSAMNTWFEIILCGTDAENLQAAGEAALDEIARIEKLLSRFDPVSEVSRINQEAGKAPVLVDVEMAVILQTCLKAFPQTSGFFDVTARQKNISQFNAITFDAESRLIAFQNSEVRLDFGAFGKGYALDCAAHLLRDHGVQNALLHGGTSSVLAIGKNSNGHDWQIGLRNSRKESQLIGQIGLSNQALSSSGTSENSSDILNPHDGMPLEKKATCFVIAQTAAQAEIFSTALLCMGREQAVSFLNENKNLNLEVLWSDDSAETEAVYL